MKIMIHVGLVESISRLQIPLVFFDINITINYERLVQWNSPEDL